MDVFNGSSAAGSGQRQECLLLRPPPVAKQEFKLTHYQRKK